MKFLPARKPLTSHRKTLDAFRFDFRGLLVVPFASNEICLAEVCETIVRVTSYSRG